ncbi:MAG: hypothetical protein AAF442_08630 [Pseudomonadota bacterium]
MANRLVLLWTSKQFNKKFDGFQAATTNRVNAQALLSFLDGYHLAIKKGDWARVQKNLDDVKKTYKKYQTAAESLLTRLRTDENAKGRDKDKKLLKNLDQYQRALSEFFNNVAMADQSMNEMDLEMDRLKDNFNRAVKFIAMIDAVAKKGDPASDKQCEREFAALIERHVIGAQIILKQLALYHASWLNRIAQLKPVISLRDKPLSGIQFVQATKAVEVSLRTASSA